MGSATSRQRRSSETSSNSVDALTDEQLYELILNLSDDSAINPPPELKYPFGSRTWRLSDDAVVKLSYYPTEAFMMSYVSKHTSIPVPKVRRVLDAHDHSSDNYSRWIVMDRIDGSELMMAWRTMSWWRRFCTMWTIWQYIRELQTVPIPRDDVPGPFDETGKLYACIGYFFTEDDAGPFSSNRAMAEWFDRRRFDVMADTYGWSGAVPKIPKFGTSYRLRLCHMDLNMRNIMIDRTNKVWIIDWAYAGAFPPWFEYAQMAVWDDAANHDARPPKVYTHFMRFMAGEHRRYKVDYLDKLKWAWGRHNYDFYPLDYFSKRGINID